MVNKWTLYVNGAKQLRAAIDATDVSCHMDVDQLAAVPIQTLEHVVINKMVYLLICKWH